MPVRKEKKKGRLVIDGGKWEGGRVVGGKKWEGGKEATHGREERSKDGC